MIAVVVEDGFIGDARLRRRNGDSIVMMVEQNQPARAKRTQLRQRPAQLVNQTARWRDFSHYLITVTLRGDRRVCAVQRVGQNEHRALSKAAGTDQVGN